MYFITAKLLNETIIINLFGFADVDISIPLDWEPEGYKTYIYTTIQYSNNM